MDRNLEHTASLVNAFIDLLEEEEKKQDLLASWKGFAIEVIFLNYYFELLIDHSYFFLATTAIP